MKQRNKKGFTLAELLIVVAIVAVLAAIAIPIFNMQLEKSRIAVDEANLRSAKSMAAADALQNVDVYDPNKTYFYSFAEDTASEGSLMMVDRAYRAAGDLLIAENTDNDQICGTSKNWDGSTFKPTSKKYKGCAIKIEASDAKITASGWYNSSSKEYVK